MLLGGIGTSCVALDAAKYGEKMAPLASYQWLYMAFVILTTGAGLAGIWSVVGLVRKKNWGYNRALWSLLAGSIVGGVHMVVSNTLRGSSAPANMVFYFTVFTLLVFLIVRLTPAGKSTLWNKPSNPDDPLIEGGAALVSCGLLILSTPIWAMPTHILVGQNWVNQLLIPLLLVGGMMMFYGLWLLKNATQDHLLHWKHHENVGQIIQHIVE